MYITIFYGISLCILASMRIVNMIENRRRDRHQREDPVKYAQPADAAALDLTDFKQPGFRYVL